VKNLKYVLCVSYLEVKIKTYILALVVVLALSVIFLNGCANTQTTSQGILALSITDATSELNISEALVTVSKIQVHKAILDNESDLNETEINETDENETDTNQTDNELDEGSWITILSESKTFDLVTLQDARDVLGNISLESGKYTQIRLTVESAVIMIDGKSYNLTVPSEKIKIVRPFEIVDGNVTDLTLDFDLFESVHQAGSKYVMNPTIKLLNEEEYKVKEGKQKKCKNSGGNLTYGSCCKASEEVPNSCAIGACGCSSENSKKTKTCKCPENKCFNGESCV
jgi:hypothetical protein